MDPSFLEQLLAYQKARASANGETPKSNNYSSRQQQPFNYAMRGDPSSYFGGQRYGYYPYPQSNATYGGRYPASSYNASAYEPSTVYYNLSNKDPEASEYDTKDSYSDNGYDYDDYPYGGYPMFSRSNSDKRQKVASTAEFKPKPKAAQQMYVIDRFGNLYPYPQEEVSEPVQERYETPKNKIFNNGREIDANDLIKMLLGGCQACEQEEEKPEEEKEEEKAESQTAPSSNEKTSIEETPLTREGLAEILSQLANAEIEEIRKEEKEEEELKEKEKKNESKNQVPVAKVVQEAPGVPVPQLTRKPTAPSLKVHKSTKSIDDSTKDENEEKSRPVIVEDVKVSAPQLKKKDLPFSPALNIYEFKTKYIVVISLPGVNKEFVDIDFHPTTNELIIKGEAKNKYLGDDEEANSFILKLSEQRFGNFERVVKLPAYPGIEDSQIKAKFSNGILEIKLPKVDESKAVKQPKKIILEEVPDEELERESSDFI